MFFPAITSKQPLSEPTPLFVSCCQFSPTANKSHTACWKHGKKNTSWSSAVTLCSQPFPRPIHLSLEKPHPFFSRPWQLDPTKTINETTVIAPHESRGNKGNIVAQPPPLQLQLDPSLPQSFPQGFPVSHLPRILLLIQLQCQVSPSPAHVHCNRCKAPHSDPCAPSFGSLENLAIQPLVPQPSPIPLFVCQGQTRPRALPVLPKATMDIAAPTSANVATSTCKMKQP